MFFVSFARKVWMNSNAIDRSAKARKQERLCDRPLFLNDFRALMMIFDSCFSEGGTLVDSNTTNVSKALKYFDKSLIRHHFRHDFSESRKV